jgi:preprotein translocase subunit SecE
MSNNAQPQASSGLDMFKWVVALAIVAVGVYGNSFYANDYSVLERTLVLLVLAAVALPVVLTTSKGSAFLRLVKESRSEIRRVVWPTRQETTQTTLIVVLVVVVMALILWALDWALNQIVSLIIG